MSKTMIKVISLATAIARRQRFSADASNSTIPWEFFTAFSAPEPPLNYNRRLAVRRFGRPLTSGELGCYTSHYKVWQQFIESDCDQIFVLEDDTLVDWGAIDRLSKWDFSANRIDIMRLFATHPFPYDLCRYRFMSATSHLVRSKGLILGTQGYVLTRRAAEALLSASTVISLPIDWVMARYWEYGIANYCLMPFPLIERYGPSSIGEAREQQHNPEWVDRIYRLYWRVKNRALRTFCNVTKLRGKPFGVSNDVGSPYIDVDSP